MPLTGEALFLALGYQFMVFYLKYSRASQFPLLVTVADLGVATDYPGRRDIAPIPLTFRESAFQILAKADVTQFLEVTMPPSIIVLLLL